MITCRLLQSPPPGLGLVSILIAGAYSSRCPGADLLRVPDKPCGHRVCYVGLYFRTAGGSAGTGDPFVSSGVAIVSSGVAIVIEANIVIIISAGG